MSLSDILTLDRVAIDEGAADPQDLLRRMARLLSGDAGPEREASIGIALLQREQMGSTGIGHGIALPHGRSDAFDSPRAALLRLRRPVAFGASDEEPVDIVLALAVPAHFTHQHLVLLAEIAERLSDAGLRASLRTCEDPERLRALAAGA